MKFTLLKEPFENALSQIIGVVEKRQTLPILGNVFLHLESGVLTLVGSDLETEITTRLRGVSGGDGQITVSARKLYDICRALPGESLIAIELVDGAKMSVTANKSRFTLQTLPASDYPRLTETQWDIEFSLEEQALQQLLTQTSFSMAQQDVRYFLNGLLIELSANQIVSVATDGHRLAKTTLAKPSLDVADTQSIVPRKAVLEMAKFLSAQSDAEVALKFNASHVLVTSGDFTFISKLIDGRFPDYEKVIPRNLNKDVQINRAQLIDILSRAAILSNEKFRGVSLTLSEHLLSVSSHNPDQERASDEMEIDYTGESIEIGFNVNYLLDALKACGSETIQLGLLDPNTSCTINATGDESTLYLIMPMRL